MVKEVASVSTHLAAAAEELSLTSGETSQQVRHQLYPVDVAECEPDLGWVDAGSRR